jgi:hypothetical protein
LAYSWTGKSSHSFFLVNRLLDIKMNNGAIPGDCKKGIVAPIYKGGNQSVIGNYRLISLTSMI